MIRNTLIVIAIAVFFTISLAGCGSSSNLTAVPLTEPWDKMNLPIRKDDIVHKSSTTELGVVAYHPASGLFESYMKAIEASGWKRTKVSSTGDMLDYEKDGKKMSFYFLNNKDEGYFSISFSIN